VLTVPHAVNGRCLAEFQALPGSACVQLPTTVELSHLLMAQQLGTVIYALRQHPLDLVGTDVAASGQGSAATFFTFALTQAGAARVLVSDLSPARLAYGRQLGADLAVDAGTDDFGSAVLAAAAPAWSSRRSAAIGGRYAMYPGWLAVLEPSSKPPAR
jgi:L-iditol 2-dehydrogenase